ncbi:MAG: SPOR domain-containing protein [Melioribacteraceae bacterium]|jgi:tetratricopeptide (TPR) repeat protein|nr:SPOR domain-containing protein [Melioribacteraceae bacterium]
MKIKSTIFVLFLVGALFAQEVSIVEYLKAIEDGDYTSAVNGLSKLKTSHPNDPSVYFLDAVLTEDGNSSVQKYQTIYEQHPKSNYADAALYRVFSYYYSLGVYKRAEDLLTKLKNDFPSSPYIRAADRTIPDEVEIAKEPVKPAQPPVQQIDKYNFTIQAGAFLNLENAQNLANAIQNDGYPVELGTKSVGGSILNVVMFGQLLTEQEASPLLSYLKSKYDLNGRVISVE